jgi:hypothetical protein
MWVRDYQIIELLDVVAFQGFNHDFAFTCIAGIDKNCLAACGRDQD